MRSADFLIVGGGILGLTVARSLLNLGAAQVVILEKEPALGLHSSGRNSGVLHAGLYYSKDSLKGKFCLSGAQQMKAYARDKGIPCPSLGKVLLASNQEESLRLECLFKLACSNGVAVERLSQAQLSVREPKAKTFDWALFSPTTSVINPLDVLSSLRHDLQISQKCTLLLSQGLLDVAGRKRFAYTKTETIQYGHLINVAGLHADRIAHLMQAGEDYELLPFRGRYLKVRPDLAAQVHGLIYPTPDPRLPFLGVHFTRAVNGDVYVGPTAAPALGRENYSGTTGIQLANSGIIARFLTAMLWRNSSGIRTHVKEEFRKQWPGGIWRAARKLVPSLKPEHLTPSEKVGIRAQLVHRKRLEFIQDFVIEKALHSTHVLNAVSPGFTAAFAFAEHIASIATA